MKLLAAADTSDEDKAINLCWVLHLIGDLHQPLHCAAFIASKAKLGAEQFDPPHGDEGGNRLAVKLKESDTDAVILHAYWDALLFHDEKSFVHVDATVAKLLNDPKNKRDQFPQLAATDYLAWAEESFELAKTVAYKGGSLKALPLPPHQINLQGLDAPVLPDGYKQAAEATATQRIVLAGYRLADQLGLVFKDQ
jgi:hypothetical protein